MIGWAEAVPAVLALSVGVWPPDRPVTSCAVSTMMNADQLRELALALAVDLRPEQLPAADPSSEFSRNNPPFASAVDTVTDLKLDAPSCPNWGCAQYSELGDLGSPPLLQVRYSAGLVPPLDDDEMVRRSVSAVFFWWQLFGDLVILLLAWGPLGLIVLIAAAAVSSGQLASIARPSGSGLRAAGARLRSKIAFRLERRWRVLAIKAFRVLPEIAVLDNKDLGILAGHLQRTCARDRPLTQTHGHIYIPARRGHLTGCARAAAVTELDPASQFTHRHFAVILPSRWREFLSTEQARA